ncbi:MAG: efflux RND transporter periplasmic adaptor subunit [Salaquimonas sp.]|jgi:RND family efflux transporter MFP subunit|nr:efflux RND transporter periplasmic adaptor subunit [Salaquimonas sp.]
MTRALLPITALAALAFSLSVLPASAGTLKLAPTAVTEWKAVYGRVEARDTVPARARIGGTVVELLVSEGDAVTAGQKIAKVHDDKIAFQIAATDAQLRAGKSQLETAQANLDRAEKLVKRGVATAQQLDQLRTAVDVARNNIAATEAQRSVLLQQTAEGDVLAPVDGKVITVPVTRDAVIMAGETVATIGGGGFFLRLAIPERHAASLEEGAEIQISSEGLHEKGRLAKIYPQIENGRVIADVEVDALDTDFVDARVLVEVPVGHRTALLVPEGAVLTRSGIDFVKVEAEGGEVERAVIIGRAPNSATAGMVEILTGLAPGDMVVLP